MDVAHEAGVSVATASRVLNGSGTRQVRADLMDRVLAAAATLNYSANAPAQAMARGRTNVVGLLVHDIADPFFSSIAAGVMRAAERHGSIVMMYSTTGRTERELDYLATLRGQRPRAVILAGSRTADRALRDRLGAQLRILEEAGARVALISQRVLPIDTVLLENREGARLLARRLVELGHRRFAVLAGPRHLLTARDRLAGFQAGLADRGVTLSRTQVAYGDFTRDGGYATMRELLARDLRTGCVFAVNDVMAVGAISALRDHGVPLPGGMAVAGFDDIVTLRDVTPSLTTVRLPLEEVGTAALELVMQPRAERPRLRRIRAEVVVRDSTPALC
ncbi:LacI family DNA-binding transcriptional regulator [Plantactinospora sp. KLBMP9567]|uniref:LacI family DNA-binding transcriptional regulator n=1 Tax=Plantactinospora sp. KLBMP9567 TaxID=3085900 RepID=UPI002981ACB9|nr:LacI family DNA-binding transcriptional regulator [Plantactinospora sp. KLBMP9567]MDW5325109.1 LacI family DNA-binding transcriptional regulator [Plantactinospora sp. KLBMP9567]MDW5329310.1 LacI family DNA-binding transcriptional regulator [Plantactinospora sp. KLBMP9567]